jgi:hypothetical protein
MGIPDSGGALVKSNRTYYSQIAATAVILITAGQMASASDDAALTAFGALGQFGSFQILRTIPPANGPEQEAARRAMAEAARPNFERLLDRIEADETYAALVAEAQMQVGRYNERLTEGAPAPDFTALNSLREAFKAKFQAELEDAKLGFALNSPGSVDRLVALDPLSPPVVSFAYRSPLYSVFDYDRLAYDIAAFENGTPSKKTIDYRPYVMVARMALPFVEKYEAAKACEALVVSTEPAPSL